MIGALQVVITSEPLQDTGFKWSPSTVIHLYGRKMDPPSWTNATFPNPSYSARASDTSISHFHSSSDQLFPVSHSRFQARATMTRPLPETSQQTANPKLGTEAGVFQATKRTLSGHGEDAVTDSDVASKRRSGVPHVVDYNTGRSYQHSASPVNQVSYSDQKPRL